jgi:hypothetical protein
VLARRRQLEPMPGAARLDQLDEQVRQRQRLGADRLHVGLFEQLQPALDQGQ